MNGLWNQSGSPARQDLAHERVKAFTRSVQPDVIVTTEEVLTEYPNYFAGSAVRGTGPRTGPGETSAGAPSV
jgi:hypothetical protein